MCERLTLLQNRFDFAVALKCFGVSISYLIVIGALMPKARCISRQRSVDCAY